VGNHAASGERRPVDADRTGRPAESDHMRSDSPYHQRSTGVGPRSRISIDGPGQASSIHGLCPANQPGRTVAGAFGQPLLDPTHGLLNPSGGS
jgi:hypothetical protein